MTCEKRALVLGLGLSGQSAGHYLFKGGWKLVGLDRTPKTLSRKAKQNWEELIEEKDFEKAARHLRQCQLVVISPGFDVGHPLVALADQWCIPRLGELELGVQAIAREGRARALIGITGSNGKTTVTRWLQHVVQGCGHEVLVAGNIGVPLTSCIETAVGKIVIVEISSFQLQTMHQNAFDAAAILNITPNHLDRHSSFEEYAQLKCALQKLVKDPSKFIVSQSVEEEFGAQLTPPYQTFGTRSGDTIRFCNGEFFIESQRFDTLEFLGNRWNFHVANFCATLGLAKFLGVSISASCRAGRGFKKPQHRLEWIINHNGVDYFDDSKATSLDAVVQAVDFVGAPILLIAGGVHKGAAYTPWIRAFFHRVRCIFAIGEAATLIERDVGHAISVRVCASLEQAVQLAHSLANPGDRVLLSPGCSSFDMFENYQHRGREFTRALAQLTNVALQQ